MKPVNNHVIVKLIEEKGLLVQNNDQYRVVEVTAIPKINPKNGDRRLVSIGEQILVTYIREFSIKGEKIYVVNQMDIVCIIK